MNPTIVSIVNNIVTRSNVENAGKDVMSVSMSAHVIVALSIAVPLPTIPMSEIDCTTLYMDTVKKYRDVLGRFNECFAFDVQSAITAGYELWMDRYRLVNDIDTILESLRRDEYCPYRSLHDSFRKMFSSKTVKDIVDLLRVKV